ncbi:MAG: hypothetical protein E4H01_14610, partial [Lysobacterales bacterium]
MSCDSIILICLAFAAVICALAVALWIVDERCAMWKQHAEDLKRRIWYGNPAPNVVIFPDAG